MNHIAVFARWPEPGRVKTRLSPALPPALACELHRAMLGDALAAAAAARAESRALIWADAPAERSAFPVPSGFEVRDQRGADLGARLEHAFAEMLRGPDDRAVVLGADCPDLDAARIGQAFDILAARDLVLGPARDGGYYLIGLRHPAPGLFRNVTWSTPRVLAQTLERAGELGLRVAQLAPLDDLDSPADLVRWLAKAVSQGTRSSPRTSAALRAFGLHPHAA
jgi:rSAM/selenodomain-associated transferase 1